VRINDSATQDIYDGEDSKAARKRLPKDLWRIARRKLDLVLAASDLESLRVPPSNQLEKLVDNLKGFWSIRINQQFRVIFRWDDKEHAYDAYIHDYH
jgi:toxin HigB-1